MNKTKKTYFFSDLHLGAPYIKDSKAHEARIVEFLESIKESAKAIYILGDIFDFWYEYKHVIPKGSTRFLGKIAELVDYGIDVHFFGGNHDMWMFDYFQQELGVTVHHEPTILEIEGKTFYLAHGEDLGIDDKAFKSMLKLFRSKSFQKLFSTFVHPNWAMSFAKAWSIKSRHKNSEKGSTKYLGEDKEHLVKFAKSYNGDRHIDYFLFGHRHIVLDLMFKKNSRVIILGDWIRHYTYAEVSKGELVLTEHQQHI